MKPSRYLYFAIVPLIIGLVLVLDAKPSKPAPKDSSKSKEKYSPPPPRLIKTYPISVLPASYTNLGQQGFDPNASLNVFYCPSCKKEYLILYYCFAYPEKCPDCKAPIKNARYCCACGYSGTHLDEAQCFRCMRGGYLHKNYACDEWEKKHWRK